MNRSVTILFLFFCSLSLMAQINGFVVDTGRKPIESVHVQNVNTGQGVITDSLGFFSIGADVGEVLEFQHLNYSSFYIRISSLSIDTLILQKKDFSIEEVNVVSPNHPEYALANETNIKRVPSFLGEPDVIQYLGTLPGVTSLGMLDAGIYVRGGNSSQNAYLVNGNPVADPQHIAGLLSTFDPYILNHSKFYKSGFPSEYNGYLASYIDMKPMAYLAEAYNAELSLGLLSSSVKLKIKPDRKKKTLLGVSFRQSYFQLLAEAYNRDKESNEQLPSYSFNDLTLSYDFSLSERWKLTFFSLMTTDHLPMDFGEEFDYGLGWSTFSNSIQLAGELNKRVKAVVSVGYNRYKSDVAIHSEVNSSNINKTRQLNLSAQLSQSVTSNFDICYGFKTTMKQYDYNQEVENASENYFSNNLLHTYTEGRLKMKQSSLLIMGMNATTHLNNGYQVFLSPRFKFAYNKYRWSAWMDYSQTLQFEERMNMFTVQSPVDIWLPIKDCSPSKSDQLSLGGQLRLSTSTRIHLGVFYKYLHEVKEFETFNRVDLSESIDKMISGTGTSKGGELDFIYNSDKLYARVNYTLSHVKTRFEAINNGVYFDPPYDVRHNVLFNTSFKVMNSVRFNLLWTFKSGVTATIPTGVAIAKDIGGEGAEFIPIYEERYNYRMPSTHRMDINFEYKKKTKGHLLRLNVGAYNIYNQQNPSFVFVEAESEDDSFVRFKLNSNVVFPFMPYFTVTYGFGGT
ncbi:outer membrane cobalamin receptor protein [Saccharicrinis fermentans DSM 9555 = JCM 21142]|uniref:Outer membrane cobalamin receptor protein n=2 Tax=Saccharicrinis fermentans TaxID=982 RepID=W7YHE8_9BACT|nr:outer membrane cobalamin receptor protein [Saccharicrinis fermentans DSM 9555 = JCM 21142]